MATTFRLALTTLRLFAARDRVFTCVEAPFFRTLVRLRFCFGFFMALIYAPPALAAVLAENERSVIARGVDDVGESWVHSDDRIAYLVRDLTRSEEHTSELQSLMRISYAVFCMKKKKTTNIRSYIMNRNKNSDRRIK